MTESWANGPLGLEQTFTVRARPVGGRLALGIRVSGSLRPTVSATGVRLGSALRYGDLVATDARGRRLPAHLSVSRRTIEIDVDGRYASYPVTIDPIVQLADLFAKPPAGWAGSVGQSLMLTPSDGLAGDGFGSSVAISGSTVVSGAPFRQIGFNAGLGIGYVFGLATPVISITAPADGGHYARGAAVTAAYGCTLPGSSITECSGTVTNGGPVDTSALGTHRFSVTAASADGTSYTKTATYSVDNPPALSPLKQAHRRWRLGRTLATIARARTPVGTSFRFTLSEPAAMTFTFARTRPKHKLVTAGALALSAHKGTNTVTFDGRISRKQKLSPGTYKLTATASASGVVSKTRSLTFTIIR